MCFYFAAAVASIDGDGCVCIHLPPVVCRDPELFNRDDSGSG